MSTRFTFTHQAVASAVFGLAAALPVAAAPVSFAVSGSVTDTKNGSATALSTTPSTPVTLSGFDPSLGVLAGAELVLRSTRTQTTAVTVTAGNTNGSNGPRTTIGTGTSSASLAGAGLASTDLGTINLSDSCSGTRHSACSDGAATSSTATNVRFNIANPNALVGASGISVTASLPLVQADQGNGQFNGQESTTYTVDWMGTLALEYTYLLHSAASFARDGLLQALDLDFGDVALGSMATLGFGLFNLGGDRVGLDLDAFSGTGDTDRLTTNLALFTALAAGSDRSFQATLDTATAGLFEATYTLLLSDADIGAEASRSVYTLTLNLRGNVLAPAVTVVDDTGTREQPRNDVPEPATLALLATGLVGLGASRRRAA